MARRNSQVSRWRRIRFRGKTKSHSADRQLFFLILGLVGFGIVMVYNTSVVTAFQEFGDKFYFARLQGIWAIVGLVAMLITAKVPYKWWRIYAKPMMYVTIGLLVLVLIPGISSEIYGARRWLSFGNLTVQPGELAKLTLVIYLSHVLAQSKAGKSIRLNKEKIKVFLGTTGAVIGLVLLEPDLGTALVLAGTAGAIYWVAGAPLKHFGVLIGGGLLATLGLIMSSPYRVARLKTFFNPSDDPLGSSYHIRQVLLALGSGGITGLGLGQSRQKYAYLPEVSTDSIFAVIAEEVGFIGASLVMLVFLFLIYKGLRIASKCEDQFGKLLATGMIIWLGLQAVVNFSAMVVLIPLTGIPLPLISYGGSSLVVAMASLGIILNISKHSK